MYKVIFGSTTLKCSRCKKKMDTDMFIHDEETNQYMHASCCIDTRKEYYLWPKEDRDAVLEGVHECEKIIESMRNKSDENIKKYECPS